MSEPTKKLLLTTAAIAMASALSGEDANATTISISVNQLLSGGGSSVSGAFDLSPYINSGGTHYHVTDAQIAAYGFSDAQYQTSYGAQTSSTSYYTYVSGYYTAVGYYYYSCGWGSTCSGTYYYTAPAYATGSNSTIYQDVNKTDTTIDKLSIGVGTQSQGGPDTYNAPVIGAYYYVGSNSGVGYSNTFYQRDITSGYFGVLGASLDLDANNLAQINSGLLVPFLIQDVSGQFLAQDVTLTFDTVADAVPEPATWMMLISGFGALAAMMRRRQLKDRKKGGEVPSQA